MPRTAIIIVGVSALFTIGAASRSCAPCVTTDDCNAQDYCAKIMGSCDNEGVCQPRPTTCSDDLEQPVCGCDGQTYKNACFAAIDGVSIAYDGECEDEYCKDGDVIVFPDENLRSVILGVIGKAWEEDILCEDVRDLTSLRVPFGTYISSLVGMEHLRSLSYLDLFACPGISDITPLAGLTHLWHLELTSTNVSDISPLSGLLNLTYLHLQDNDISDISPLAGLHNLSKLYLNNNFISDLSPLAGLVNLTELELFVNDISDIAPLSGLTMLEHLDLSDNSVSDLTPLAGLNTLTLLYLDANNISDVAPLAGLSNLSYLYLCNNNISDIHPLAVSIDFYTNGINLKGNPLDCTSPEVLADIAALEAKIPYVSHDCEAD